LLICSCLRAPECDQGGGYLDVKAFVGASAQAFDAHAFELAVDGFDALDSDANITSATLT
jgi:hypothetical protein